MSINEFKPEQKSTVTGDEKSGSFRVAGQSEPEILASANREARARELEFVRDLLARNNFTPAEVLNNDNLAIWAEKEFRKGQGYLFGTAEEYVKVLESERRKKSTLPIKK